MCKLFFITLLIYLNLALGASCPEITEPNGVIVRIKQESPNFRTDCRQYQYPLNEFNDSTNFSVLRAEVKFHFTFKYNAFINFTKCLGNNPLFIQLSLTNDVGEERLVEGCFNKLNNKKWKMGRIIRSKNGDFHYTVITIGQAYRTSLSYLIIALLFFTYIILV